MDVALLGIFVVEICLKTAAYGSAFILDTWVVFDTTVITAALGFAFFVLFNPNIDEMTSLAVPLPLAIAGSFRRSCPASRSENTWHNILARLVPVALLL